MNTEIYYFSQTGHTKKVAETMAKTFRSQGHQVHDFSIHKAGMGEAIRGDLIGIGTPTFESHAPTPVMDFVDSLPSLENRKAFVFATGGGAPGRVFFDLKEALRKKGASVVGEFWARGEIHHPAPCIKGKMPARPNEGDFERTKEFALVVADHLAKNRSGALSREVQKKFVPDKYVFYSIIGTIVGIKFLHRALVPKPKLDKKKCVSCQWCVKNCPTHNIEMKDFPVMGKECIRCFRCSNGCPQQAYAVNWWLGNIVIYLLWNETFMRWFGDYD